MTGRIGRQTPTTGFVISYTATHGQDAINLYEESGKTAQEWQTLMLYDILAYNDENLWVHTKFGYSIPRRNGKNEVVSIRELYALFAGERVLHTAHRTTTSSSAAKRLAQLLEDSGYEEVGRPKKGEDYGKAYTYTKQFGLEKITLLCDGKGSVDFRTRTSKGGLGEGFDLLIIDEAQEYQDDQETSLKYVVSDSPNPQTLFCGTPPTAVSTGTVFPRLRENCLTGNTKNTGWAEWSVEKMTNPRDIDAWYETNPSLGTILTERKIEDEVGDDEIDFNIQRLGLWLGTNQKSAISEKDWNKTEVDSLPKLKSKLHIGIKYGRDGQNVAMSLAVKTCDERIFVECFDCVPVKSGNAWILEALTHLDYKKVVVDGAGAQNILSDDMKQWRLKKPLLPTVKEVIDANAAFKNGLDLCTMCHGFQPSVNDVVNNCERRAIGSNGGFGYKSMKEDADIAILDSMILAYWSCTTDKN